MLGAAARALHEMMVDVHEDLARVRVARRRVACLVVVDVDAAHVVRELGDPLELLVRERPQRGVDFRVLADTRRRPCVASAVSTASEAGV